VHRCARTRLAWRSNRHAKCGYRGFRGLARVETAGSSSRNRVNDPAFGSVPTAAQSGRSAWRLGPRSGSRARRAKQDELRLPIRSPNAIRP
jgi:hypothetical protein